MCLYLHLLLYDYDIKAHSIICFQSVLRGGHHVGAEMACQLSKLQRCMLNLYEPRMKEVVQHHHHDSAQVHFTRKRNNSCFYFF